MPDKSIEQVLKEIEKGIPPSSLPELEKLLPPDQQRAVKEVIDDISKLKPTVDSMQQEDNSEEKKQQGILSPIQQLAPVPTPTPDASILQMQNVAPVPPQLDIAQVQPQESSLSYVAQAPSPTPPGPEMAQVVPQPDITQTPSPTSITPEFPQPLTRLTPEPSSSYLTNEGNVRPGNFTGMTPNTIKRDLALNKPPLEEQVKKQQQEEIKGKAPSSPFKVPKNPNDRPELRPDES